MIGEITNSGQVLRAVSESLRTLVRTHITELSAEDAVVFDSPAEIEAQGENKLSLFLYQSQKNPYLRNAPFRYDLDQVSNAQPAGVPMIPPPLALDLVYMMVPYAKSAELELVLADKLMRLFHEFSMLPSSVMHPTLLTTGNSQLEILSDHVSIDNLRNIWNGFPNKAYRFTQLYQVTPVRIPVQKLEEVDMVTGAGMIFEEIPRGLQ